MANLTDLKNSIVTKLQGITSLKNVYDDARSDYDGYPCAVVLFNGFTSEIADTARDLRTYNFTIEIIQERMECNFGGAKAERVLKEAIYDVLTAIDADSTFSNSEVAYTDPFEGEIERDKCLKGKIQLNLKALIETTL